MQLRFNLKSSKDRRAHEKEYRQLYNGGETVESQDREEAVWQSKQEDQS